MLKKITLSLFIAALFCLPLHSFAWGFKGHRIVAQIAAHYLPDSIKLKVQKYLGKTTFEEAATWMDESRSNDYYSYMRSWHFINMEKGEQYKPVAERNALTVLHAAIKNLKDKEKLKKNKVKEDLLLIFHLVGDLHQPLHVGYGSDRGGNSKEVSYIFKSYISNLHSVWDTEIIESEKITTDTCIKFANSFSANELSEFKKINELAWMRESRSYLDEVYNYKNDFLDKNYVLNNKSTVTKQLLLSGIRLAAVLEELFK